MRIIGIFRILIMGIAVATIIGVLTIILPDKSAYAAESSLSTPALITTDLTSASKAAMAPGQSSPGVAEDCTFLSITDQIRALEIDENDPDAAILALLDLQQQIRALVVRCRGYAFEGTGDRAVGPIALEPGVYRIWVRGGSRFSAELAVFRGTCATPNRNTVWNSYYSGSAENGGEVLIFSEGCEAVIVVDPGERTNPSWEVIVEPVRITIR